MTIDLLYSAVSGYLFNESKTQILFPPLMSSSTAIFFETQVRSQTKQSKLVIYFQSHCQMKRKESAHRWKYNKRLRWRNPIRETASAVRARASNFSEQKLTASAVCQYKIEMNTMIRPLTMFAHFFSDSSYQFFMVHGIQANVLLHKMVVTEIALIFNIAPLRAAAAKYYWTRKGIPDWDFAFVVSWHSCTSWPKWQHHQPAYPRIAFNQPANHHCPHLVKKPN